jgi:hypothetical protein
LDLVPPRGIGNAASLDTEALRQFARDAKDYVAKVCDRLRLHPARIGIDAPSAPSDGAILRRAAEVALDRAGISCFATPSADDFYRIRVKVQRHLAVGGAESRIPHANQLWMLAGFAIFEELSRIAPCLEVFPQATVRAMGAGQNHKSTRGAAGAQLAAATRHVGWPLGAECEDALCEIAWGASHDQLDAYLSAWVAGLDESDRMAYGSPPKDAIWVPKILTARWPPSAINTAAIPNTRRPDANQQSSPMRPSGTIASGVVLCPACGRKEFKRWPWGWDGHAAHACSGLAATVPEDRKSEFRHRFAEYFGVPKP